MRTTYCLVLVILIACYSCENTKNAGEHAAIPATTPEKTGPDTVSALGDLKENDTAYFEAPDSSHHLVVKVPHSLDEPNDSVEEPASSDSLGSRHAAHSRHKKTKNVPCNSENFDGVDRKKSKLSFASAAEESFDSLAQMIRTLQPDQAMGSQHHPAISTDSSSARVKEEKRNVRIKHAWIFAFSRESDEDYHVIIGSTDNKNTAVFFNSEISGLPSAQSAGFHYLSAARDTFENYFGLKNHCHGGYETQFIDHPVEVEIKGSLFFDELHYQGHATIGTGIVRPKSYWEIHPIKAIRFL